MNDKLRKALFYIFMTIAIVYGLYLNMYYYIERTTSDPNKLFYEYLCFADLPGSVVDFKHGLGETYTSLGKKLIIELPASKIAEYYQSEAKKNGWLKEEFAEFGDKKIEVSYKQDMLSLFIRIVEIEKDKCTVTVYMSAPKTKKEKSRQRRAYLEK